jgi:hypothetical protein
MKGRVGGETSIAPRFPIPLCPEGPAGPQGPPGDVSQAQLATAVPDTARNPLTVAPITFSPSDPPTQAEFQAVIDKVNELIAALTRA